MRITVFSDSHGSYSALESVVKKRGDTDCFLHLGDGERELEQLRERFPDKAILNVRGNCDWSSGAKVSEMIAAGGKKIFFTHGHAYNVKAGLEDLKREAIKRGADIVLFGHTHRAVTAYDGGIYYMNPGSVACPRDCPRSYGIIDITEAGVVTFVVEL